MKYLIVRKSFADYKPAQTTIEADLVETVGSHVRFSDAKGLVAAYPAADVLSVRRIDHANELGSASPRPERFVVEPCTDVWNDCILQIRDKNFVSCSLQLKLRAPGDGEPVRRSSVEYAKLITDALNKHFSV